MEVRIGVIHTPKELVLEVDGAPDEVTKVVDEAVERADGVLWLGDVKGRRVGVPSARIAYVEIETGTGDKRVGFSPS